jgi:hypothetical protein
MASAATSGPAQDRARVMLDEAVADGAMVVTGGGTDGPFFRPTVVTGVSRQSRLWTEEIFAPIAPVLVVTAATRPSAAGRGSPGSAAVQRRIEHRGAHRASGAGSPSTQGRPIIRTELPDPHSSEETTRCHTMQGSPVVNTPSPPAADMRSDYERSGLRSVLGNQGA